MIIFDLSCTHGESGVLTKFSQSDAAKRKRKPKESETIPMEEADESVIAFPKHQGASVHLAARSLSYFVPDKKKKAKNGCCGRKTSDDEDFGDSKVSEKVEKQILRKINFDAKPGELTAILGPSGMIFIIHINSFYIISLMSN